MPESSIPWENPTSVGAEFVATSWTDLRAVGDDLDPARQLAALERICRNYWKPIYAFLRRRGHDRIAACDLTQDFFHHLLSKERLRLADQRRGRFRSFVLKALNNFLASDWDKRTAKKRDERIVVSLDEPMDDGTAHLGPADPGETPDRAFDRQWATGLLNRVRARLEAALRERGQEKLCTLLPLAAREDDTTRYVDIGAALEMSEAAVKKAVERLRAQWAQLVREEVAATVQSRDEIEEELADLLSLVARA